MKIETKMKGLAVEEPEVGDEKHLGRFSFSNW
jgi:hypothetical protein